ncbi:ABC transporter permease subunit [Mesorhizobium sp. M1A.F.Ca.IN.022.07.1.1]|uniref:ABC transporter permease subunit n=1 Tax=unclassified Mesorhizobium TaxID=325217 RepID=UPI000FC9CC48|nr:MULTISPECIES: ABC transporter permease subunit [unclassified Mesorhizobium]RUV85187.1 ABC transporter permease subunit [Mesorhizobium sp. M1A.F.Ca.IN.022.07.1.1]RWM65825.1 MAG: ABC transporter permease subunit [Mesorhizobium sp.]RWM89254.1 MAG: ABC transporter permease subunit [Mesorhizobium sp.]TIS51648.1 MAG: ABC transporter permease subunit [Mesorhizobium sp.]TJV54656.1 MAG: ABC transporter permease subunit [Mesorhizobium sp.]
MTFDWSVLWASMPALLDGAKTTVLLTVLTMAVSIPGGIFIMLLRVAEPRSQCGRKLQCRGGAQYPAHIARLIGLLCPPLAARRAPASVRSGLLSLSLIISAYNAETFRAGVNSISRGQSDAALALGMSRAQVMRKVVLPQAARRVLPILANTWVSLFRTRPWCPSSASTNSRSQRFRYVQPPSACWRS